MIETTEWRQMNDRYDVSSCGLVRLRNRSGAGPAGRLLLPCWAGGAAVYLLRADANDDGKPVRDGVTRPTPLTHVVARVWGLQFEPMTRKTLRTLRAQIQAHNEECFPEIRERSRKIAANSPSRPPAGNVGCPFAMMETTNCPEYPSWDCPEMDPMTNRQPNGVWFDAPKPKRRRKRAVKKEGDHAA